MKRSILIIGLLFFLVSIDSNAQSQKDFFQKIKGDWIGEGNLFGAPAKFSMNWEIVLADKFARLSFHNEFKDGNGTTRSMDAEAFYKFDPNASITGNWFDTRGLILPLKCEVKDNTLIVLWGDKATEQGKTEYQLISENQIAVKDFVMRNGEYAEFGGASYKRKK